MSWKSCTSLWGLAYEEGDESDRVYLFAKSGKGTVDTSAELFDSLSVLKDRVKAYNGIALYSASICDVLEWRWQNLVDNRNDSVSCFGDKADLRLGSADTSPKD